MSELVTVKSPNGDYQYDTSRLWFLKEGTMVRYDGVWG